ncbi:hypothetical protein GE061_001265 [Apolygus lucorum]|uniref:Uncharacterized protein n=1 Tax=Apolygus lucorum TaxID=248454 RepID=A0A8S9Y7S9_APOLU|nr:hypothetical protein GE061_001265 [Apolygus lucorum]
MIYLLSLTVSTYREWPTCNQFACLSGTDYFSTADTIITKCAAGSASEGQTEWAVTTWRAATARNDK